MNRRTTHTIAMLALASLGVLVAACEDEKKPAPPAPSATTTADAVASDVTLDNYEKELESLDKEIASKY